MPISKKPTIQGESLSPSTPYALRPREAAEYISVSERTLRELLRTGKIRYAKLSRAVLVPVEELEQFIDRQTVQGGDR
jgi:excisionase family DNA binding protein